MLAIVIPYYKFTFFEATLSSLASQTSQDFCVYIGDDASPDKPNDLLEKYKGKFKFVYHRFDDNLGKTSLVSQWERCIALVNNESWVMILGDDDVLGDNVVKVFYDNLTWVESKEINVVRFATQKIDKIGKVISDIYKHPRIENSIDFLFRDTRSSLSEYVFLKEQLFKIGFKNFPLAWFSDVLAVLEFSNFKDVYTLNHSVISIRISNESISGDKNNLKLKSESAFAFYYYLLSKKHNQFTENQKKQLRLRIGKCYLNDKKRWFYFFKISTLFLSNWLIKEYLFFIKSIFLNFFIHKNASRLQSI